MCQSIGEPVIPSEITYDLEEAKRAAERIGYPVVLGRRSRSAARAEVLPTMRKSSSR
jgi:biotin carboxylase